VGRFDCGFGTWHAGLSLLTLSMWGTVRLVADCIHIFYARPWTRSPRSAITQSGSGCGRRRQLPFTHFSRCAVHLLITHRATLQDRPGHLGCSPCLGESQSFPYLPTNSRKSPSSRRRTLAAYRSNQAQQIAVVSFAASEKCRSRPMEAKPPLVESGRASCTTTALTQVMRWHQPSRPGTAFSQFGVPQALFEVRIVTKIRLPRERTGRFLYADGNSRASTPRPYANWPQTWKKCRLPETKALPIILHRPRGVSELFRDMCLKILLIFIHDLSSKSVFTNLPDYVIVHRLRGTPLGRLRVISISETAQIHSWNRSVIVAVPLAASPASASLQDLPWPMRRRCSSTRRITLRTVPGDPVAGTPHCYYGGRASHCRD